jgi:hypothetical protein
MATGRLTVRLPTPSGTEEEHDTQQGGPGSMTEGFIDEGIGRQNERRSWRRTLQGGIPQEMRDESIAGFTRDNDEAVMRQQSMIARDAARRGMMTSGQMSALQNDAFRQGQNRIGQYRTNLDMESFRFQQQGAAALLGFDMQQRSLDAQRRIANEQLESQNALGWGKLVGTGLGLLLAYHNPAVAGAVVAGNYLMN